MPSIHQRGVRTIQNDQSRWSSQGKDKDHRSFRWYSLYGFYRCIDRMPLRAAITAAMLCIFIVAFKTRICLRAGEQANVREEQSTVACPAVELGLQWLLPREGETDEEVAERGPCGVLDLQHYRNRSDYHFLGLGVQKGGTTTLFKRLSQHPNALMGKKETQFFLDKNLDDIGGLLGKKLFIQKFYWNNYDVDPHKRRGEITPEYQARPEVARRVRHVLGSPVRFLVMLREPVSRAYSFYQMHLRSGNKKKKIKESFEETIRKEYDLIQECRKEFQEMAWYRDCYLTRFTEQASVGGGNIGPLGYGFYYQHLYHWFKVHPPCSFLILEQQDLNNPGVDNCLWRFLDLKPYDFMIPVETSNHGGIWMQEKVYKESDPINPKTEARLRSLFSTDVLRLERLLGRKFHQWGY